MSSPAPKRRLDVPPGSRKSSGKRAKTQRKRRSLQPSPAMAGAFALIVAGVGATVVSSHTDSNALAKNYQIISASYTSDGSTGLSDVDISRSFNRNLAPQAELQAVQKQVSDNQDLDKVEARADELQKNLWIIPVTGYHLSARFGQSSGLWSTVHTGLDFAGPSGSPIVSIAAGEVVSTGYEGAYGNRTIVRHLDGTEVWYCHQSSIAVKPGDKVSAGQPIGYTGSTGNVTGPHLHLEIRPGGGNPVDPYTALIEHGVQP